jgi:hypothetical protein
VARRQRDALFELFAPFGTIGLFGLTIVIGTNARDLQRDVGKKVLPSTIAGESAGK